MNDGSAALVDDALGAVGIATGAAEEAEEAEEAAAGEDPESSSPGRRRPASSSRRRPRYPRSSFPAEVSGLLPVVFRAGGARRWFLAVDATRVARIAFAFGDDARTPPVGPWRATAPVAPAAARARAYAGRAERSGRGVRGDGLAEARAGGVLCGEGGRAAIARVEYDAETEARGGRGGGARLGRAKSPSPTPRSRRRSWFERNVDFTGASEA